MRRFIVSVFTVACICSLAFAGDDAHKAEMVKAHGDMKAEAGHMHMPMNNVFMMKEDGSRMAMCGCGKEFAVTDKSPTVQNGGMTMYCCSQECHDHAAKASKEEMQQMMGTWMKGYDAKMASMAANTMMADGKKMAKCGCGKEFAVTDKSPMICENGVMMYCCSEQCHEMMMKMSAEDRMSAEMKVVKPMKAQPAQSAHRNNDKLSPEAAFDEISKILFMKIRYERNPDEENIFTLKQFEKQETNYEKNIRPVNIKRNGPKDDIPYMDYWFELTKDEFEEDELFDKNEKNKN